MNKMWEYRAKFRAILSKADFIPPLMARLTVGFVFVIAGWGKLNNLAKVTEFFTSLGIPLASVQAPFVSAIEFFCGLLLLVGLATRVAAIPLIGTMVVAIITAKKEALGSFMTLFETSEYLYIPLLAYLVFYGAGKASVDYFLVKDKPIAGDGHSHGEHHGHSHSHSHAS